MLTRMLRQNRDHAVPVTNMELFFDLVFVFAITQLSHLLLHQLTGRGVIQTAVIALAVWWAWNYTAWATGWVDPESIQVRLLLIVLMLISLLMAAAIPEAFGDRGLWFATAYVALQVVRSAFMAWALRGQVMGRNYAQLLAWTSIAGVVWIVGGFLDGDARLVVWILAVLIDYSAPMHGFRLPWVRATPMGNWSVAGAHLAERNQQVVIVALGESMLATGAGFSEAPEVDALHVGAMLVAFIGTVVLWWVYFARHAEEASRRISGSERSGEMGRAGFAYAHALMVAGIVVSAVADQITLTDPGAAGSARSAAVVVVGPLLYLLGNAVFGHALLGYVPRSRLVAAAAVALCFLLGPLLPVLGLVATVTGVLVLLACADAYTKPGEPAAVPGAAPG